MKRSAFISFMITGAASLAIPTAGCRHYGDTLIHTLGQPDFLGHLCDAKTIADIGVAYRTAIPEECHRPDLIELLLKEIPGGQDAAHLSRLLNDRIRNDFATDNTITIRGWVLSRTEARQCAIYSCS